MSLNRDLSDKGVLPLGEVSGIFSSTSINDIINYVVMINNLAMINKYFNNIMF